MKLPMYVHRIVGHCFLFRACFSNKDVLLISHNKGVFFPTVNRTGSKNVSIFAKVTPKDWKADLNGTLFETIFFFGVSRSSSQYTTKKFRKSVKVLLV